MGLHCVIRVTPGVYHVAPRSVSMVRCLFMVSSLMMLGGFCVVMGGTYKVL
jgi:hypothetical protein